MTQNEFKELQEIVKTYTTDDIVVVAVPKNIKNNGKMKEVIELGIIHKLTKKASWTMYRGEMSNFRNTVKKAVDQLVTAIHKQIVEDAKKNQNSL